MLSVGLISASVIMPNCSLILTLVLAVFWLAPADTVAQDGQPGSVPPKKLADAKSAAEASPARTATTDATKTEGLTVFVKDGKGNFVPIANNVTAKKLLQALGQQGRTAPATASYHVTSVDITGFVRGKLAELTAVVRVEINDDGWVRVPLRMQEALLRTEAKHTPPANVELAAARPETDDMHHDGVRFWFFRGRGTHVLSLPLSLAIRDLSPAKRLRLTVPETAASSLSLRLPLKSVKPEVTLPVASTVESTPDESGDQTVIQVYGLSPQLDLVWSPKVDPRENRLILQTKTRTIARLTSPPFYIKVTQEITRLSGKTDELAVELPAGFEFVAVDGTGDPKETIDENNPQKVSIKLDKAIAQTTRLDWTLKSTAEPAGNLQLKLEAMRVQNSKINGGTVEVITEAGYQLRKVEEHEVARADVGSPLSPGQIATAYEFQSDTFRLALERQPIAPSFTVEPFLFVALESERIRLNAIYRFRVDRGVAQSVLLKWPKRTTDGWKHSVIDSAGLVIENTVANADGITVPVPAGRSDAFEIRIQASKVSTEDAVTVQLNLPYVESSGPATTVIVSHAIDFESQLRSNTEQSLQPVPENEQAGIAQQFVDSIQGVRPSIYRIASGALALEADVSKQKQQISVSSEFEIDLLDEVARVTQRLHYKVEYQHTSQVRLMLPTSIGPALVPTLEDGTVLLADGEGLTDGSLIRKQFQLPEATLGKFDVKLQFDVPLVDLTSESDSTVSVPFVTSSDVDGFALSVIRVRAVGRVTGRLAAEKWSPIPSESGLAWRTTEQADIQLAVRRLTQPAHHFTVPKSAVQIFVNDGDALQGRVSFVIDGDDQSFDLTVPNGVSVQRVWWNDEKLDGYQFLPGEGQSAASLRINSIPATESPRNVLSVDFNTRLDQRSDFAVRHSMQWPRFHEGVWVEQTAVDLRMPTEQYLFDFSQWITPSFEWQRRTWFWSREPLGSHLAVEAWLTDGDTTKSPTALVTNGGNRYQFGMFGQQVGFYFISLRLWWILVIGAGAAWTLSLIWRTSAYARRAVSLPIAVLLVAVAGLWFADAMKLLVQPFLVGLALSLVQAAIERHYRRKRARTNVLMDPTATLVPASGQIEPYQVSPGVGTEDPTHVRPGEPAASRTSVSRA